MNKETTIYRLLIFFGYLSVVKFYFDTSTESKDERITTSTSKSMKSPVGRYAIKWRFGFAKFVNM